MIPETTSRQPREGTDRFRVYKEIKDNLPPWDRALIGERTGLTRRKVSIAIANLRNSGYLPKPTREEKRQTRQLAAARILLPAKVYREMGMSIREVRLVLFIGTNKRLTYDQVHGAIGWGTRSGTLRVLSEEERKDIKTDGLILSSEKVSETVAKWLVMVGRLKNNGILPTSRLEWKQAIEGNNKIPLSDKEKDILFAAKLLDQSLIGNDMSYSNDLKELYSGRESELADLSLQEQLRLEAFLKAITEGLQGNNGLRDKFRAIGEEIDRKWFYDQSSSVVRQQVFIRGQLKTFKH